MAISAYGYRGLRVTAAMVASVKTEPDSVQPKRPLDSKTRAHLAHLAGVNLSTIEALLAGSPIPPASFKALHLAALKLGIQL